ncbi:hypothetical protein [Streptomyces syringium]|uniref:hypothetical protein n=1 Tax=Streptomyces syringium TaxID=76729 RepID=UPI0033D2B8E7
MEYGISLPGPQDEPQWWRMRFHARGRDDGLNNPVAGEYPSEFTSTALAVTMVALTR